MNKGKGKKPLINGEEDGDGDGDFLQHLMNHDNRQLNISSPARTRNPTQNNILLTNGGETPVHIDLSSSSSSSGSSSSKWESAMEEPLESADENDFLFNFLTACNDDSASPDLAIDGLSSNPAPTDLSVAEADEHGSSDLRTNPPREMDVQPPKAAARKYVPMRKAMCHEELAELSMQDPKKANRIIANRMSAVRAKEKKKLYMHMLEHKLQSLYSESVSLKAHLTLLQTENTSLSSESVSLREQTRMVLHQLHLQDSLNAEVRNEIVNLKALTQMNSTNGMPFNNNTGNYSNNNLAMGNAPLSSVAEPFHTHQHRAQTPHQVDQLLTDGVEHMRNLMEQQYPWQAAQADYDQQLQQMIMQQKQQDQDQEQQEEIPPVFHIQDPDIADADSPPFQRDEDSSD